MVPLKPALTVFDSLSAIIQAVEADVYGPYEMAARQRISGRGEDDCPLPAIALALRCPIWTEDFDFFGTGAATWTTGRVELYLDQEI